MRAALHKSAIPESRIFVVKDLNERHFDPKWHSHSEYQLFLVTAGTGTRFVGESIKTFGAGELVFTGPNLPHLWRNEEIYFDRTSKVMCSGIVIYFRETFLGDTVAGKEEFILLKKLFTKAMRGVEYSGETRTLATKMMTELVRMEGIQSVIQLLGILGVLASSKEYNYLSPVHYETPLKESETYRMNVVYEYIFKNYRQQITLQQMAALLHMTPTSFSRYFSIVNNKSFSRFLAEIRIKNACTMLLETDTSITNICYNSGFNTLSNFNSQFKSIMLKTPMEYKREFFNL